VTIHPTIIAGSGLSPEHEHVAEEGSKVSSLVHRFKHAGIDSSMVEWARGDMAPGNSMLVLLTADAAIDAVAKALSEQGAELIRSDLSVQEQDQLREASGDPGGSGQTG
jgi:uncharacterized membrane protein